MSRTFQTVNPASDEVLAEYELVGDAELAGLLEAVEPARSAWAERSVDERAAVLRAAAARLREEAGVHAELMAREMGKPLSQGRAEKCAWVCEYYAEEAAGFLEPDPIATDASRSYVSYQPLGAILAVMPWNFPYWQVFRVAAPNLAAGNAVLLKHAMNTTGCGLAIERLLVDSGLPEGVFRTLLVDHDQTARLIEHPVVRGVTLTGSDRAGRAVGETAGRELKKVVLELGGSDPYVVLEDADLEHAAQTCVASRLINGGQSCISAKRFIVVEPVRERFTELVVEAMRSKVMDDPFAEGADLGPQARELRDELQEQVDASVSRGARLLLGGRLPDRAGAWYPPTVLDGVEPGMRAHDEETFGPVASIVAASDERDAVRIANATSFGLGAAVFTGDVERGRRLAERELRAGSCFVNGLVKSDPRLPFGGIGISGHGRELGEHGFREFLNVKTVWVR